jgi:hypothetical protein
LRADLLEKTESVPVNSSWTQEQRLLEAALALESQAPREVFFNLACPNDPTLWGRIASRQFRHSGRSTQSRNELKMTDENRT